jgi:superfamily I DNA/RNA helicase
MARTFHSLGRHLLVESRLVSRHPDIRPGPSQRQWRWLSARAMRAAGTNGKWIKPHEAKRELSKIKLGRLLFADEYAAEVGVTSDGRARSLVELYKLYEQIQGGDADEAERRRSAQPQALFEGDEGAAAGQPDGLEPERRSWLDYDDLILRAVKALRADAELRARWQSRWQYVLVDEYQDIEPAQEALVRMIAAPHDQLFCVGDEDQTLYAFRRASVARIIRLDEHYPALQRVSLRVNYRCPPDVVEASKGLIEHNAIRFDKPIEPMAGREGRPIEAHQAHPRTPTLVAQTLATRRRGDIVVLARTKLALRPVALACAVEGVRIDGPAELFDESGHARGALRDHLRLALFPEQADARLVHSVCKTPGHWVGQGAEAQVVVRLGEGAGFRRAFEGIPAPKHERGLLAPGELFEALAKLGDAAEAIALMRGPGGMDSWFEEASSLDEIDEFDVDTLEQAQRDATGRTLDRCLARLDAEVEQLKNLRDKENGIELTTIHRAKGRQWPHVIVVGCDHNVMPHRRAQEATPAQRAKGEGIEAERRLAYVALTRTTELLELYYDKDARSQFLDEAGILGPARPAVRPRAAPPQPPPISSRPMR